MTTPSFGSIVAANGTYFAADSEPPVQVPSNDVNYRAKLAAVTRAVSYIQNGMTIGLGTGSTAVLLIPLLAEKIRVGWQLQAVPTSDNIANLAAQAGIPLVQLSAPDQIDVTIDGADEVDRHFNIIKGYGGALLREKAVAQASKREIIVVDPSKLVERLGLEHALPVETVRFAADYAAESIRRLGARCETRMLNGTPFLTDNGNYIVDCYFSGIADPVGLGRKIHEIAGVVEHGLFLDLADVIVVGHNDGTVEELTRPKEIL